MVAASSSRIVPDELRVWRETLLIQAGFAFELAQGLAADGENDLHALLNLVDRGCPPDVAARILAPR
jgi:hypothetical protein